MSMISAQCDRLRNTSQNLNDFGYREAARELRDAADTIETLRDMAQDADGERRRLFDNFATLAGQNAELSRENERLTAQCSRLLDKTLELADENARLKESLEESEHDESMAWDRVSKADADNAKLRERLRGVAEVAHDMEVCITHLFHHHGECEGCPLFGDDRCDCEGRMSELGIEC